MCNKNHSSDKLGVTFFVIQKTKIPLWAQYIVPSGRVVEGRVLGGWGGENGVSGEILYIWSKGYGF